MVGRTHQHNCEKTDKNENIRNALFPDRKFIGMRCLEILHISKILSNENEETISHIEYSDQFYISLEGCYQFVLNSLDRKNLLASRNTLCIASSYERLHLFPKEMIWTT